MLLPVVNTQKRWLLFLLIIAISVNTYLDFTFEGPLRERGLFVDSFFAKALRPLTWSLEKAKVLTSEGGGRFVRLWSADIENQKLKQEISLLALQIQELQARDAEASRLLAALKMSEASKLSVVVGRVIGFDRSLFRQAFEIDRGLEEGILNGMPVLSRQGVVGRIVSVSDHRSTVLLITDLDSRVEGINERTRARVVVGGSAEGVLKLRYLPRRVDLKAGDRLITSGFGGFFPEGFLIGTLKSWSRDPHFVLESADLEPAVDMDQLEEVLVVKTVERWPSNP